MRFLSTSWLSLAHIPALRVVITRSLSQAAKTPRVASRILFLFQKHSDILLFWGNDADLRELHDALTELAFVGQGRHFAGQNCGIDLRLATPSTGAQRQAERRFDWAIDRKDAADFRDKLAALIASSGSGHQYLSSAQVASP